MQTTGSSTVEFVTGEQKDGDKMPLSAELSLHATQIQQLLVSLPKPSLSGNPTVSEWTKYAQEIVPLLAQLHPDDTSTAAVKDTPPITNSEELPKQRTANGNTYMNIKAVQKAKQLNGHMGKDEDISSSANHYGDCIAGGESRQINGHMSEDMGREFLK